MPDGYMWRMEGHSEKWTAMLYDDTVITINERGRMCHVELVTFMSAGVAYDAVLQMTDTAEGRNLELYRVYGCRDTPMLRERVTMARREYARNRTPDVEDAAKAVWAHIIGNSTILFPTMW